MSYLTVTYSIWKQITQNNSFSLYHISKSADVIEAWSGNKDFVFKTNIDAETYSDWSGSFLPLSSRVSSSDDARACIYGLSGLKQMPRTSDGKSVISVTPPEVDSPTIYTHDWTDPTTWYTDSVRVIDETASNSGNNQTYNLSHNNIIDTYHGKLFGENFLTDISGNSYRVDVKVNGTSAVEQDPHYAYGENYTINYRSGSINFTSSINPEDIVTVTYYYENGSSFWVKPTTGKKLKINTVEAQFSQDVIITDSVEFQTYGMVNHFAPQYTPNPYPSGTLIPLLNPLIYKGIKNYCDDANGVYPVIPALSSGSWRGIPSPIITFPWKYQAVSSLDHSRSMRIRIRLLNDIPFSGSYSTATIYCLSENE